MSENMIQPTDASVPEFLDGVLPARRRTDSLAVLEMMQRVTGEEPAIWTGGMVGFGRYQYAYKSGRTGDWFRTGFAPRKAALSIYIMPGFDGCQDLLDTLGKHRTSVSCLYISNLDKIDPAVLEQIIRHGWEEMARLYS